MKDEEPRTPVGWTILGVSIISALFWIALVMLIRKVWPALYASFTGSQ